MERDFDASNEQVIGDWELSPPPHHVQKSFDEAGITFKICKRPTRAPGASGLSH
jgi:hypothetical protein